ncbi:MAG: alpha/beta fold hydrolase, partial [Prevotellaceae bacterium]|nr:alpha/beta fold hydrolase [Prevotellaceae bacterium]
NRNEEIMGHKPFLVLADYLTRNGIAVLRYDDRGFGESKGDAHNATTENFADDAEAAVNYLKSRNEIDKTKIGLIGHSEGGIVAPMIAAKSDDIAFIVLLAGSAIKGSDLLLLQTELVSKAMGTPDSVLKQKGEINKKLYNFICNIDDEQERKAKITEYLKETISKTPEIFEGQTEEQIIPAIIEQTNAPWIVYFVRYNPAPTLEKVKCPVLAVNGSKDMQVPSKVNLDAINAALTKGVNTDFKLIEFEELNHLFQECNTGSPMEYAVIKQTFSPTALEEISNWIIAKTKP